MGKTQLAAVVFVGAFLVFGLVLNQNASFRAELAPARKTASESPEVFSTLEAAIRAQASGRAVNHTIATGYEKLPQFPSFSACEKSFFRVATVDPSLDEIIAQNGWKSGWARREDQLRAEESPLDENGFDALSPNHSFEERIVEYVRVKDRPSKFPKHSTVVGVLANPIRTLNVGYHTGFDSGSSGKYMRMDEIELGPCATSEICKRLTAVDSTQVFKKLSLTPRYSTEGEFAVDRWIPKECVIATYRIVFQKVGDECYSDANQNCGH